MESDRGKGDPWRLPTNPDSPIAKLKTPTKPAVFDPELAAKIAAEIRERNKPFNTQIDGNTLHKVLD